MVAKAHAEYHKVLGDKNRSDPMRAALTAALAEMWRAIEEAPKDGTYVLVWRPDEGDCHHEAHAGIDTWTGRSWYRSRLNQQPTHFMPLPAPPSRP